MHITRECPRVVIAGTSSGVGKTTITAGLLAALRKRGLRVQSFKIGPDYIDPGFHSIASGRESYNLDTWLVPPENLVHDFSELSGDADISVIEGVMGLFDGGKNGISSTADIAKRLDAPVILVIDCKAAAQSVAALVLGFTMYDPDVHIAGVILNRLGSARHMEIVKDAVETKVHVPVLGAFLRRNDIKLPERHLGLVPADESDGSVETWCETVGTWTEESTSLDRIIGIAGKAPSLSYEKEEVKVTSERLRIAIAEDEAFSFFYPLDKRAFGDAGVELVPFSPLHDREIPKALGLILSGGFPEMFLNELSSNRSMMESIRRFAEKGFPVYAECGGLMVLTKSITGFDGETYPMADLVPAVIHMNNKLQRVGYMTAGVQRDSIIAQRGDVLHGHEFHFSSMGNTEEDFPWAYSLKGSHSPSERPEGYCKGNILATYLHISWRGNPKAMKRFIEFSAKKMKSL